MKYLDIHTHVDRADPDIVSIFNKSDRFENLDIGQYYSCGLHPWFINVATLNDDLEQLTAATYSPMVMAIGECGLDKVCETDFNLQLDAFIHQIRLANVISKPLIIHCIRAYDEILKLLNKENSNVPVIFHGFNKSYELASRICQSGYYLSFGRHLEKEAVREVFRRIPDDRVFLETDNSELPVSAIYELAAAAKCVDIKTFCKQIFQNAETVFKRTLK
jgi:TatD DNase family protein